MLLHPPAHLRDQALGGLREHLGERERRAALNQRRHEHRTHQRQEQVRPPAPDHVVDQELGRAGQDDARQRLTAMRTRATKSTPLRGRTRAHRSGRSARSRSDRGGFGPASGSGSRVRQARRATLRFYSEVATATAPRARRGRLAGAPRGVRRGAFTRADRGGAGRERVRRRGVGRGRCRDRCVPVAAATTSSRAALSRRRRSASTLRRACSFVLTRPRSATRPQT